MFFRPQAVDNAAMFGRFPTLKYGNPFDLDARPKLGKLIGCCRGSSQLATCLGQDEYKGKKAIVMWTF